MRHFTVVFMGILHKNQGRFLCNITKNSIEAKAGEKTLAK